MQEKPCITCMGKSVQESVKKLSEMYKMRKLLMNDPVKLAKIMILSLKMIYNGILIYKMFIFNLKLCLNILLQKLFHNCSCHYNANR